MSSMASALVAPGAIVAGKYKLETVVGEGGMGSVWSATHTGLGQPVAIKFISKEFVTSAEALRRFDAEAKAAAQLRSRHVVQVFDNGTLEDGTPYIAMELLRGENVYARVHRAGPVPLAEGVEILVQSCKALARAHAAGIVHRDIKPDNIFLAQSADDEAFLVKILDFGIAKFAVGPNDHGSTRTGAVLGTPLYMSPEQARGLKTIDHRTDLYSLGLVAYTIFTGNLAFSSESFGDLLLQICTAPLPSLCANAPWLPAAMDEWFKRACAREPKDRFATAQEFADALRSACAPSLGPVQPLGSIVLSNSGLGSPAENGSPAVPATSLGTDAAMIRSGGAATSATTPERRSAFVGIAILVAVACIGVAALATSLSRRGHSPADSAAVTAAQIHDRPSPVTASSFTPTGVSPPPPPTRPSPSVVAAPPAVATEADVGRPPSTSPARSSVGPARQVAPRASGALPSAAPAGKPIDLGY